MIYSQRSHFIKDRGGSSWEWSAFISLDVSWSQVKWCPAAARFQTSRFSQLSQGLPVLRFYGLILTFTIFKISTLRYFNLNIECINIWQFQSLRVDVDEIGIHFVDIPFLFHLRDSEPDSQLSRDLSDRVTKEILLVTLPHLMKSGHRR